MDIDNQQVAEMLLYNKITDTLMFLGSNAILRMNVALYQTGRKPNTREYFYQETQYVDRNGVLTRKIQRMIDAFISLENMRPVGNENKEYIVIRGRDLELMRIFLLPKLEAIIQNFGDVFQVRSGHLYVNDKIKPIELELGFKEKTIWFKPGAHKLYNDEVVPTMEMYLNSPNNVSIMSFQAVYELMYLIRTFQLQQYAAAMLSCFEPPLGINMYDMSINQEINALQGFQYEEPEQLRSKRNTTGFFSTEMRKREESKGDTTNEINQGNQESETPPTRKESGGNKPNPKRRKS